MNAKKIIRTALIMALAVMTSSGLQAQSTTPPPQTFSTTIYFDYSFNLTNNGYLTGTDAAKALNNKFNFRRAYFRYENKIDDNLKFRFTYDADYVNAVDNKGKKDDKLRPFIKHLYLDWAGFLPNSSLKIGMVDTITFKLAEDRWSYRSVAKTLTDGYKDITGVDIRASSADLGLNLTGPISKELRYGFMMTNGEGYSHPELNKYKKLAGQLQVIPVAGFSLVGYAEYEKQDADNKAVMYKADAYFEMVQGLTVAGEWFSYDNDKFKNKDLSHYNVGGFSVFSVYRLNPDKFHLFARFDHYEPNSSVDNSNMNLLIAGFDWAPIDASWKIQPNIWYYTYADSNRKDDVVFNMTFYLSF